jgi:diacylglycerol kinase family enzyme
MVLLIAGVVLLTAFLIGNLWYLLLAWVGLLGSVVAFTRALRSSGAAQRLWLVLGFAGLVLVLVGAIAASVSRPWLFIVLVLLGILVGWLGRYVLREPSRAGEPLGAKRPVLLVNPNSGDGKAGRTGLVAEARKRGISVRELEKNDDLTDLARSAITEGADAIGIAGGDGSLGYVAAAAIEANVPFVCVPAGTRNHFARDLGLDRDDVIAALDAFSGEVRWVDYATVNDRVFLNNASLGLYAEIVADPAYRDAKAETTIATMQELAQSGGAFDLRYLTPEGRPHEMADLVFVGNNPYIVSGLLNDIGKRERLDQGKLGVLTLTIHSTSDFARMMTLAATGRIGGFTGWNQWTNETFRVDSGSRVALGIDGESLSMDPPLEFAIHRGGLRVAVPLGTTVGAQAGFFGSPRKLLNLWRVARGQPVT